MVQLTEVFRGTKSKAATKFLQVGRLKKYGAGSKYTKADLDRITHAMVYENILLESSEQNGGGFSSDYVRPGQFAAAIQNGQRKLFVDFPKCVSKAAKGKENEPSSVTNKKTKPEMSTNKPATSAGRTVKMSKSRLYLSEGSDDSDDNRSLGQAATARTVGSKSSASSDMTVLPKEYTLQLVKRIKKLVTMWAAEERMAGNSVFRKFAAIVMRTSLLLFCL
jgi:superfamily II DNA helicase RecQ